MSFEIRKTSDCGTKHPVVARLKVQTRELLSWADLSGDGQTAVVALYYGLAERLIKCHESYGRLFENLKAAIEEFQPKPGSRLRSLPYVIGLTGGVETFLYESKNFLRDLLGVFNIFFGVKFEEASAFFHPKRNGVGKLVKWATKTLARQMHSRKCWPAKKAGLSN